MSILFIDDDPEVTELYCEVIAYLNNSEFLVGKVEKIQCLALNRPREALHFLSRLTELPDYIFLDINMPGVSGKECLINLKGNLRFSHVPVVMLSTVCRDVDKNKFLELGAIDCVEKPAALNDLVKLISTYIFQKFL